MKLKPLRAAVLAALIPAFAAGCVDSIASQPTPATPAPVTQSARPGPDFTRLVEQAGPAVVNISVTEKPKAQEQSMDPDDPMFQFFRHFDIPLPKQPVRHGVGSGFIVSPEGYILTNAHVVDGAKDVDVKLTDRREFKAKVIGSDPKSDIALIKIDAANLPVVRIGHSKDVKVGEWVVAMGSPFGFENSVTAGIVSATSRSLPGDGFVPFIQTDVAVNPGNSGGPLFDMDGNVVGINSQIFSQTGGYMGLSFAIPIDVAMQVRDQLQAHGHVTRGRIGVAVQSVNQALAQSFGMSKTHGALVSSVEDRSPAARAGIKAGDVILAWNGQPVEDSGSLPVLVAATRPGDTAKVSVWRERREQTLDVKVGRMPDDKQKVASADENPTSNSGRLGLVVRPSQEGLVVEDASGPAAAAGVQEGDVILALNNQPVKTPEDLRRAVSKAGKHAALLVQRNDSKVFVPIELG